MLTSRSARSPAISRRRQLLPGPGRVLDGEVGAEELVVLQQCPDDQVVDREPHRSAPVGVAAVHRGAAIRPARTRWSRPGTPGTVYGVLCRLDSDRSPCGDRNASSSNRVARIRRELVRRDDRQQQPPGVAGAADLPVQHLVPVALFQPAGEPFPQPADAGRCHRSRMRDRGQRRDHPDQGLHPDRARWRPEASVSRS